MKKSRILCLLLIAALLSQWTAAPGSADEPEPEDIIYQGLDTKAYSIDYDLLEDYEQVHPRLLMNGDDWADIVQSSELPAFEGIMTGMYEKAEIAVLSDPPESVDGSSRSYDPIFSSLVDYIPTLAIAYLLSEDERYLDAAVKWIEAVCGYPAWESVPDLATGQTLMALGLAYDWLFDDLDANTKALMRAKMLLEGDKVYEKATLPRQSYWNRQWLQNHMWIAVSGMATAAMALYDEEPSVMPWLETANKNFSTTMSVLPEDGANQEGMDYWFYGMESLFIYADMSHKLLGTDLFATDWFEDTIEFVLHNFLPRNGWTPKSYFFPFADSVGNGNIMDHMLRLLAKKFNNGYMQWLADETIQDRITVGKRLFLNLFWYNPSIASVSPQAGGMSAFKHFDDLGIVNARSSWDGNESALFFRSGPPLGHREMALSSGLDPRYDWGAAHVDPASNAFLLFGNGELLLRDDGYAMPKYTVQHNTLMIDGQGQLSEGVNWLSMGPYHQYQAEPRVVKAVSAPGLDHIVGDAAEAYSPGLGLTKYERHLLFIKPDVLIVVDDIELNAPRSLELRFWPQHQAMIRQSDGGYVIPGVSSNLHVLPLTPEGLAVSVDSRRVQTRSETSTRSAIRLQKTTDSLQNAVAIAWSDAPDMPRTVTYTRNGPEWTFAVDNQVVTLNTATGASSIVGSNHYQTGDIKLVRDGQLFQTSGEAATDSGMPVVPLEAVLDALGAGMIWDAMTQTAQGSAGDTSFELTVGDSTVQVNNEAVVLPVAPSLVNGEVYVPLRFIAEVFASAALWNSNTHTIRMTSGGTYAGASADLSAVAVEGKRLHEFDADTTNYVIPVVGRMDIPGLIGISDDPEATIEVVPAQQLPGTTLLRVTSADGATQKTYHFQFVYQHPRGAGVLDIVDMTSSDPVNANPFAAVDRDFKTFWTEEGIGRWLKLDLGEVKDVNSVALAFYQGDTRTANFDIELSVDDSQWTQVYSGVSSGSTTDPEFYDFAETAARYVRIVGNGNSKNGWNSMTEVGVFDSEPYLRTVSLSAGPPKLLLGEVVPAVLSGSMSDSTEADFGNAEVIYASDLPSVAAVDDEGVVTAVGVGDAEISAIIRMGRQERIVKTIVLVYDGTDQADVAPSDDTYTVAWRTNDNFGTLALMEVRNPTGDPGTLRQAFMKFDLSELGGGVIDARLMMYGVKKASTNTDHEMDITLYEVSDDTWTETTLTAGNKPALGDAIVSGEVTAQGGWVELDVTGYAYEQHVGDGTVSIGIYTQSPDGYMSLYGKDSTSVGNRPYLRVITRDGPPDAELALSPAEPDGLSGWYVSPVTAALGVADPFHGGATLEYSLDDAVTWQAYTAPLLFDQDGEYELLYRAKDRFEVSGPVNSRTLMVDVTAPTAQVDYSVTGATYGPVTATITPSEPVTITNNGGSASYVFHENGQFTFEFVDEAGNTGSATAVVTQIVGTAVLFPSDDAFTVAWRTNDNFGSLANMEARNPTGDPGTLRQAFMKFDLSELSGSVIDARLIVYGVKKTSTNTDNEVDITLYEVDDDTWTETTLTAGNKPALGDAIVSGEVTAQGGWIELDVTGYVYEQHVGDGTVSIGIYTQSPDGYVGLISKDGTSANYRPYLLVTAREGPPDTTLALSPAEPDGLSGWYVSPVTAALEVADPFHGGATLEYSLDDAATWQAYAAPLLFDQDGEYELLYRAKDRFGAGGPVKSRTLMVDVTVPTAQVAYSVTGATYGPVTAWITPSEPVTITNNGGSASYVFDANGQFTFEFVDEAGNVGSATAVVSQIVGNATLAPSDDTYTVAWRTNDNFGTLALMEVRNPTGDPGTLRQAFMKFDLSGLGGNVVSAKLAIYGVKKASTNTDDEMDITLYEVDDDMWTETTLTAGNKPALGDAIVSGEVTAEGGWVELDVTGYVYDQHTGDGTVSIGIYTQSPDGYMQLYGKDSTSVNRRPYLQVITN